jgi:hypothetical protein
MISLLLNELFLSSIHSKNNRFKATNLNIINESNDIIISTKTFEPQLQMEQLQSMGIVTSVLILVSLYWWNVVIPAKRTEVAKSKNRGEIKEYLDDIRDDDDRNFERWFLSDWLNKSKNKPAAIPFLKKAKWNSGDNPVLVAFAGIFSLVLVASIAERGGGVR